MEKQKGTLALTRKQSETFIIQTKDGDTIKVGISQIQGNRATVFIQADKDILIVREELLRE